MSNGAVAEINRLHQSFCDGLRTTLQIAIQIGELLVEQKQKCGHGKWIPWIKANLEFSVDTAGRYMNCFRNRAALNSASTRNLTIEDFAKAAGEPVKDRENTLIPFDLGHGAFGVDRKHCRTFFIQPCGDKGVYVKWCRIIFDDHSGEDTRRLRTLKGVYETEIATWLHHVAGITTECVEWYPGHWEPAPDTYLIEQLAPEALQKWPQNGHNA